MAADVALRRCVAGDGEALSLIGRATFLETFAGILSGADILSHCAKAHAADVYHRWLSGNDHRLWIAEVRPGDAPVGLMVTGPAELPVSDSDPSDREIKRIYLLGRFQGGGLGKRLVLEAIADARECDARRLLLGVYAHNRAAIGFYVRMGFSKLGTRRFRVGGRYYDDDVMGLTL